jgi:hypothetical protein
MEKLRIKSANNSTFSPKSGKSAVFSPKSKTNTKKITKKNIKLILN